MVYLTENIWLHTTFYKFQWNLHLVFQCLYFFMSLSFQLTNQKHNCLVKCTVNCFRGLILCMFPEANYVCRIWRLWWTGLRLMHTIKISLTCVSRELFKYWKVNALKWVSFNAHNSSAMETQGKKINWGSYTRKTFILRHYLFCWFVCERKQKRREIEIIEYSEQNYDVMW